jgi:hypothetical protein
MILGAISMLCSNWRSHDDTRKTKCGEKLETGGAWSYTIEEREREKAGARDVMVRGRRAWPGEHACGCAWPRDAVRGARQPSARWACCSLDRAGMPNQGQWV